MFYTQWEFWVAVITTVTAVITLCQSYVQIQISNKQLLYDRRTQAYFIVGVSFNTRPRSYGSGIAAMGSINGFWN